MTVTIRDEDTAAELATVTGTGVEVRGPNATLLGWLTPAPRPGMSCPEFGETDVELPAEINDPDTPWHAGDGALAHLRKLRESR